MARPPTESQLVTGLLDALQARRVWAWRNNSGQIVIGKGASRRFITLGPAGAPDILGVLPGGKLFGLECKTARGRLSDYQRAWHARAEREGVCVAVVRSIGEGIRRVEAWRAGKVVAA